jgi:nucleotide-binding universal stress UspA family protein
VKSYRRLLVPLVENDESQVALDVACRLAAERGASISAVTIIEVPPLLPLGAHLGDEEDRARRLLERAGATGDSFGVRIVPRILRARDAGAAIVEEARAADAELIVLGTARRALRSTGAPAFGATVRHVFAGAPCRVLMVAARPTAESLAPALDASVASRSAA